MKKIILILITLTAMLSCKNKSKQVVKDQKDTVKTIVSDSVTATPESNLNSKYIPVNTWIDDFKNLRQAIFLKDKDKLKTYLKFPVGDESWGYLVDFSESERKSRIGKYTNPDLLYEADFDRYYKRVFDEDLAESIMKIKADDLFEKHLAESPDFKAGDFNFKLIVNYVQEDKNTLQLNLSYNNNSVDEDGEPVSEGEHNKIYIFEVEAGKKLIFQKVAFAG